MIGRFSPQVSPEEARDSVGDYLTSNDIPAHCLRARHKLRARAKGFEALGPTGPYLVGVDENPDPRALRMGIDVHGDRMKDSSTDPMQFSWADQVSFAPRLVLLEPGDVIVAGTPEGGGQSFDPPVFLSQGNQLEAWEDGFEVVRNSGADDLDHRFPSA